MRRLAAILIPVAIVFAATHDVKADQPVPATAPTSSGPGCVRQHIGPSADTPGGSQTTATVPPNGWVCIGEIDANTPPASSNKTSANPVASSNTASGPTKVYVPYNRLVTGPDGNPCVTTAYVEKGTPMPNELLLVDPNPRETNIPITGSDLAILEKYPPCPAQPLAPGQTAPVETAAMVAARYWEQAALPTPGPKIAPGRAITGKLVYLETWGQLEQTYNDSTILGPLNIEARGSYTIDWGDGTQSGPLTFEGTAWPDGRITHDYLNAGLYNVVVTEKWTALWQLGDESGVLRPLQTSGRIDNFPVQQIQAVIGS